MSKESTDKNLSSEPVSIESKPSLDKLGLGNYMIIQSILFGQQRNYEYLYLGYYIKEITSMSYKKRFKPGQILENNQWQSI